MKAELTEIEAAAVRGWPALKTVSIDGWLWRHTSGGSVRANSVATLTFSGQDIGAAINTVEAQARRHAVPACFTITNVSLPPDLDVRLADRGYARGGDHVTMAKPVDVGAQLPTSVSVTETPSAHWLAVYLSGLSPDRRTIAPRIIERLPPTARFLSTLADGVTISSGLTIADGAVASVQCMATVPGPGTRRKGGASRILQAIDKLAAQAGCSTLYLQTSADNDGAIALYRRAGFEIFGHYHTRTKFV